METLKEIFTNPFFSNEYFQFSILNIIEAIIIVFLTRFFIRFIRQFVNKVLRKRQWFDLEKADTIYKFLRLLILVLGVWLIIRTLKLNKLFDDVLSYSIIDIEGYDLHLYNLLIIGLIILFARIVIKFILLLLNNTLNRRKQIDKGQKYTVIQLVKYFLYFIAFIIALESTGADLQALILASTALLIGVGIGLQTFFYDILSGFIILFEGTFKVGDIIEIDGLVAQVKRIDIRTSKVLTRDGNVIVVPNRKLTSENLSNWTISNDLSRYKIDLGVAYGSDVEKVRKILYECALKHPDIEKTREILVVFTDFGESALIFNLYFWSRRSWDIPILLSDLRFAIDREFRDNNIHIPYPQRDLHIKSQFPSSIR